MKQLSLETLLKMLVIAQHQVDEVTAEIKRRTDGRKQRTGPRPRIVSDKDKEASS